jgi:hypothetical protein
MARLPDTIRSFKAQGLAIYQATLARPRSQVTGLYGPYTVLMHHPVLARYIGRLGYYFKFRSELPVTCTDPSS